MRGSETQEDGGGGGGWLVEDPVASVAVQGWLVGVDLYCPLDLTPEGVLLSV